MPFGFDPIGGSSLTEAQLHVPKATTQVAVTGVSAGTLVGTTTFLSRVSYTPDGVETLAVAGAPQISGQASLLLSGLRARMPEPVLGSVDANGWMTTFARGQEAEVLLGFADVAITALHVTLVPPSVAAAGAVGAVTVAGVTSRYVVDVIGLQTFCSAGGVALRLGTSAQSQGVVASCQLGTDIGSLTSSFGADVAAAAPSQWTPVPTL